MPQPDRAPAVGRLRVADGVDQVRFNRALRGRDPSPKPVATESGDSWANCGRRAAGKRQFAANSAAQETSFGLHLHRGESSRLSAERLYAYSDQGIVEQISRGLYRWADAPEIDQNLLEVAYRIPEGTLCLTTALARHGLTDNISARIDVAIPRGNRIPTLLSPIDIRVFSKDAFEFGLGQFKVGERFVVG